MRFFLASLSRVLVVCAILGTGVFLCLATLQEIHLEVANLGNSLEITRDFQMRTFHYAKPHRPFEDLKLNNGMVLKFCPECSDLLREAKLHSLEPACW